MTDKIISEDLFSAIEGVFIEPLEDRWRQFALELSRRSSSEAVAAAFAAVMLRKGRRDALPDELIDAIRKEQP